MTYRNRSKKLVAGAALGLAVLGLGSSVADAVIFEEKPPSPGPSTEPTSQNLCERFRFPWCFSEPL